MFKRLSFVFALLIAGAVWGQIDTLLFENFDDHWDTTGWIFYQKFWHIRSDTITVHGHSAEPYDGGYWWCGIDSINGYSNWWLQYLISRKFYIPPTHTGPVQLSFMLNMNIEPPAVYEIYDGWDGFNVRISTDGGATFHVIEPTPAYSCRSMYCFALNGEGDSIPGWGGSTTGWERKVFDISTYAGDSVIIAFVFSADPAICTADTPAAGFYGVLIDNIVVKDSVDTFFSDFAVDTSNFSPRDGYGTFTLTNATAHSDSYSLVAPNTIGKNYYITTPIIHVPDSAASYITFAVFCDMPDYDGDGDNSLEDYYMLFITTDNGITWERLMYDYARNSAAIGWTIWTDDSCFDLPTTPPVDNKLNLLDYLGKDIRLRFIVRNDFNADGGSGTGFHLDDLCVYAIFGALDDVSADTILLGPINLGSRLDLHVVVRGIGLSTDTVTVAGRIYNLSAPDTPVVRFFFSPPTEVGYEQIKFFSFDWTSPSEAANYYIRAWTTLSSDEDHSNDTCLTVFTVHNAFFRELAYDDGLPDTFAWNTIDTSVTPPDTHISYLQYLAPGAGVPRPGVSLAQMFVKPFPGRNLLKRVGVKVYGSGQFIMGLYEIMDSFPAPIPIDTVRILIPGITPELGTWVYWDINDSNFTLDSFAIGVTALDTPLTWFVYANLATTDTNCAFVGYPTTGGIGWIRYREDTLYSTAHPEIIYTPRDRINFFMRAEMEWLSGVKESIKPEGVVLGQNVPNPFNPATSINFKLPEPMDVSLVIYDLSGRAIRHLYDGKLGGGNHIIVWTGTDDAGREVPSGMYLYKLIAGKKSITKKMMLVR